MKRIIVHAALALALTIGIATAAYADPIVVLGDSGQVANAIDGLVVDGQTYNVMFEDRATSTTFQDNSSGASAAANAIATALNGTTAAYVLITGIGSGSSFVVQNNGSLGVLGTSYGIAGNWQLLYNVDDVSVAVFTSVPVPEPGSFALLGSGLFALGLIRFASRRRVHRQDL